MNGLRKKKKPPRTTKTPKSNLQYKNISHREHRIHRKMINNTKILAIDSTEDPEKIKH